MPTIKELMDEANQLLEEHRAEAVATGGVYKFVLEGPGGGTFVLNLNDATGVIEGDGSANCTIYVGVDDFIEMAEGHIDSRELFFAGKLRVDGDIGLALKLKKLQSTIK